MDPRIETLGSILAKTEKVMAGVDPFVHDRPTPCAEYAVSDLLDHVAVWIQVFDGAVNEIAVDFDPHTHHEEGDWAATFAGARNSVMEGFASRGFDRPMTMTASPVEGEFILNMMLMEYVGHGWDLARATDQPMPYSDQEAETALRAGEAILQPQYRGVMFDQPVDVPSRAPVIDRYVAFIGRDPEWAVTA